jgi:succinate-acetate transporter protein
LTGLLVACIGTEAAIVGLQQTGWLQVLAGSLLAFAIVMIGLFLFVAAHPTLAKMTTTIFVFFFIGAVFGLLGMAAFLASFHWIVGAAGVASVMIAIGLLSLAMGEQTPLKPGEAEAIDLKGP